VEPSSPIAEHAAIRSDSATVVVTCPSWCEVGAQDHAAALWANEGRCVHEVSVTVPDPIGKITPDGPPRFCSPIELTLRMTTNPAGREVESPDVMINGQASNIEQQDLLALKISELVRLYSGSAGRQLD
jgi:hypothetical protein